MVKFLSTLRGSGEVLLFVDVPQLGFALGVLTCLVKDWWDVGGYSPGNLVPRRGIPGEPFHFESF